MYNSVLRFFGCKQQNSFLLTQAEINLLNRFAGLKAKTKDGRGENQNQDEQNQ